MRLRTLGTFPFSGLRIGWLHCGRTSEDLVLRSSCSELAGSSAVRAG